MNKLWAIINKDIVTELRTKELLTSMLTFALLVIVIFSFTFGFSAEIMNIAAPSMLWIAFSFAGILGLSRSFALEKEGNAIMGLLVTPTDRSLIYFAKLISNTIFVFIVASLMVPMFVLFFNLHFSAILLELIPVIFLGSLGFVSVGTLFSAMALNTKLRDVLLPILVLPIVIPLLVGAVKLSAAVLNGESILTETPALKLIIAFDIIFITACSVVFEYVIEET